MNSLLLSPSTVLRCSLAIVVLLLAGCATAQRTAAVTSSSTPRYGSAPISAFDDYALAIRPQVGTARADRVALILWP